MESNGKKETNELSEKKCEERESPALSFWYEGYGVQCSVNRAKTVGFVLSKIWKICQMTSDQRALNLVIYDANGLCIFDSHEMNNFLK